MEESNDKKLILGLDVSSSTIGVTLMLVEGDKKTLVELTHCSPKTDKNIKGVESLFIKKQIFEDGFIKQFVNYGIDECVIESPLLSAININTVSMLLSFNALVSDSVYRILQIVPQYISSYEARKCSFGLLMAIRETNKKGEKYPISKIRKDIEDNKLVLFGGYNFLVDKKQVIFDLIAEVYPNIEYIYDKKGNLKKENFDVSDSIAVCLGHLNLQKYGKMEPKIINVTEDENYIYYDVQVWDKIYNHKISLK